MPSRAQLEVLLQADPDDTFLRYALAMACISDGDAAAALSGFDDVLARDPGYVAAYFQKGQLLAREGETKAARETITRGVEAAGKAGDQHAEAEMRGFLETL